MKAGGSEPLDSRGGHKVWMRKWEVVVPVCCGYYSSLHHRLNIGSALKGLSFSRASKVPVSPLLGLSLVHSSERTGSFRFLLEELNIIKNLIGPGAGSVTKPKLSSICDVKSHILVATSP